MAGLSFANEDDAEVFHTKLSHREVSKSNSSKNKKKKGKICINELFELNTYGCIILFNRN